MVSSKTKNKSENKMHITLFQKILSVVFSALFFSMICAAGSAIYINKRLSNLLDQKLEWAFDSVFLNVSQIFSQFEELAIENIGKTSGLVPLTDIYTFYKEGHDEYIEFENDKIGDLLSKIRSIIDAVTKKEQENINYIADASYKIMDDLKEGFGATGQDTGLVDEKRNELKQVVDMRMNDVSYDIAPDKEELNALESTMRTELNTLRIDMEKNIEDYSSVVIQGAMSKLGKANVHLVGSQEQTRRQIEEIKYNVLKSVRNNVEKNTQFNIFLFVLTILAVMFFVVLVSFIMAGSITRPISKMVTVLNDMARGKIPHTQIDVHSTDEIGMLASAFNDMSANLSSVTASRDELNREISERKEVEKQLLDSYNKLQKMQVQLVQAEKLSAVGRLASGVAHEVKNPLGIVLQGVNYLESKDVGTKNDCSEIIEMMKSNIKRASGIIHTLVDFSKATELNLESADINEVIRNSYILVKHRMTLESIISIEELGINLPSIFIDKTKIEQVLINLMLNAMQAMPKGGKLYIRSYVSGNIDELDIEEAEISDYFRLNKEGLVVEVEDTGAGIPKDIIKKIFDPFFTTKGPRGGAGLGLSVSRNIIEMHGGLMDVKSEEGKGARFILVFKIKELLKA